MCGYNSTAWPASDQFRCVQIYPEVAQKLLASQQGQSVKGDLAGALSAAPKQKVAAQMQRLTKILDSSNTIISVKVAQAVTGKKKEKKIKKQRVRKDN